MMMMMTSEVMTNWTLGKARIETSKYQFTSSNRHKIKIRITHSLRNCRSQKIRNQMHLS